MTSDYVPFFIISYNRGRWLSQCVASCRKLSASADIVIHDNGSDDPLTLRCLDLFEAEGVAVIRRNKIYHAAQLNNVNDTVTAYFAEHPPCRYVVTDCDIDMRTAAAGALDVYGQLLDMFPKAECAGPMIRIRDLPREYPLFNRVMNRHIKQFWRRRPEWVDTPLGRVAMLRARIDTTFALHRAGARFRRLKRGIRVYEPYEACHLDWYLTKDALDDASYFDSSSQGIAHWSNRDQIHRHQQERLRYNKFIYVTQDIYGGLFQETMSVQGGPEIQARRTFCRILA